MLLLFCCVPSISTIEILLGVKLVKSISSTSENLKTIADELTSSQKKNIMTETENDKAGE